MKSVLIIGASGLLGTRVAREFSSHGYQVYGSYHRNPLPPNCSPVSGEITRYSDVRSFFNREYDVVINCAGLTNVDTCESRPEAAWQLNATLPCWLSQLTFESHTRFIHVSTDHFLSKLDIPRVESSKMEPVNSYGYSKLGGENSVSAFNSTAVILRTNFFGLTSRRNHSLLDFLVTEMAAERSIVGFTDVIFSPIGASNLARIILEISKQNIYGLFHAAGNEILTKYDFAMKVKEVLNAQNVHIFKGQAKETLAQSRRPNYLALDSSKLMSSLKITPLTVDEMLTEELKYPI